MNFPSSPTLNQEYTFSGRTWKWNGRGWVLMSGSPASAAWGDVTGKPSLTIGGETKSLGGASPITWTLADIGAADDDEVVKLAGAQTITGKKTFSQSIDADIDGHAATAGSATTAAALATARQINGTNFDGTANVTTAQWGTARTITIGATGKSVDGSGNVSWSASDIGLGTAAAANLPASAGTAASSSEAVRGDDPRFTGISIKGEAGASYTLALADAGRMIERSHASANTTTVPPNSSVAFPVNTCVYVTQSGAGESSIVAGAGVTINTVDGLKSPGQHAMLALIKRAENTWLLVGGVT